MSIGAQTIALKDTSDVHPGYPFRTGINPDPAGDVGVIQMKDVEPGGDVGWNELIRTRLEGRRSMGWIAAGDVLFVARGPRFYAACASAPPMPAVCSPHLFQIRVKPGGRLMPEFLAWQLNQPPVQKQLHAAAAGSNQLSVKRGEIEALSISVPPLEHQRAIVALAAAARAERSLYESLIDNRTRQLEAIANTLAADAASAN